MFHQLLTPVGDSLALSFLVAILPIATVLLLLQGRCFHDEVRRGERIAIHQGRVRSGLGRKECTLRTVILIPELVVARVVVLDCHVERLTSHCIE